MPDDSATAEIKWFLFAKICLCLLARLMISAAFNTLIIFSAELYEVKTRTTVMMLLRYLFFVISLICLSHLASLLKLGQMAFKATNTRWIEIKWNKIQNINKLTWIYLILLKFFLFSALGQIGSLLSPTVNSSRELWEQLPHCIYASLGFFSTVIVFLMPETHH